MILTSTTIEKSCKQRGIMSWSCLLTVLIVQGEGNFLPSSYISD